MTGVPPLGALSDLRVLDLTQALAGPYCTQILADHGAHVIKVESPAGDATRRAGPFHPDDVDRMNSGFFQSVNRNKQGIVIDLRRPEGKALLLRLAADVDVLVENFRAGVLDRLGLSYETLRQHNPRLVYAAIRGFGDPRTGSSPYSSWPAYDVVAQAMGGMLGITGADPDHPVKVGPGVGDLIPALHLGFGILAAVLNARRTGQGQFVDVAMVDAVLSVTERIVHQHSFGKVVATAEGNHHPLQAPFGVFPASDGHVAIGCPDDGFFEKLCRAIGVEALLADQDFATAAARVRNRERLIEAVGARTRRSSKAELKEMLGGVVPFGVLYTMADIAEDEHFRARDMLAYIDVPGISEPLQIAGVPVKMTDTPGAVRHRAPQHGEHTDQVLAAAGLAPAEIAALRQAGAVQ